MILQLDPSIPVLVVEGYGWPAGKGTAIALIDYLSEHFTLWKVGMDSDGAIWDVPQSHVRLQTNISMGRVAPKDNPEYRRRIRETLAKGPANYQPPC